LSTLSSITVAYSTTWRKEIREENLHRREMLEKLFILIRSIKAQSGYITTDMIRAMEQGRYEYVHDRYVIFGDNVKQLNSMLSEMEMITSLYFKDIVKQFRSDMGGAFSTFTDTFIGAAQRGGEQSELAWRHSYP
jgi:hypothetical protein